MISDWIQVRTELVRDPKVTRILDSVRKTLASYVLRLSPDDLLSGVTSRVTVPVTDLVTSAALRDIVLATLVKVWGTANHFVREETIPGVGVEWVDEVAQIPGFGRAMQKVGWLELTENGLRFPNFNEWNRPKTNALRSSGAVRKERQRIRSWLSSHDASHADWDAKKARLSLIESRLAERDTPRDAGRDGPVPVTPLRKGKDSSIPEQQQQHPPEPPAENQEQSTRNQEPKNLDRGTDLNAARTWADTFNRSNTEGIHIPMPVVTAWHDDRTASGWNTVRDGTEFPIRDWQADLRRYARKWQQNERTAPPGRPNGHPARAAAPTVLTTAKKGGF